MELKNGILFLSALFISNVFAQETKVEFLDLTVSQLNNQKVSLKDPINLVDMKFYLKSGDSATCDSIGGMFQHNENSKCTIEYTSGYLNEKVHVKRLNNIDYQIVINNKSIVLSMDKTFFPKQKTIDNYLISAITK